ncbi:MAG TPA: YcxB family protein [Pyrinomonadaceae bacterium]|jgi:hypothetical protein
MYVKFDYTEDDLVDAAERILARSKTFRSARVKSAVYSAFLYALIVCALFLYGGYKWAALGAFAAVVMAAYQQLLYWDGVRKRLRKSIREYHGPFGTGVCEVELTPVGVLTRQSNVQVTYEWEGVSEVVESPDSIDIYTRHGGGVIVRARAFRDAAERARFRGLAEGYLELSSAGPAPALPGAGGGRGAQEGEEVGGELGHRR